MIYIILSSFSYCLGIYSHDIILFIKHKYKFKKYNILFNKIRNAKMLPENFLYRINNTCFFKFDDIYLDLSFNNDKSYSQINIVSDSSLKEIIFSSYLDDNRFGIVKKEEKLLINCLLKNYEYEINDIKPYGVFLYSSSIIDEQIDSTITEIKTALEKEDIVSVSIQNNEEIFFQKNTETNNTMKINQIDIDEILDQISINGIDSLTIEQKNILNNYNTNN